MLKKLIGVMAILVAVASFAPATAMADWRDRQLHNGWHYTPGYGWHYGLHRRGFHDFFTRDYRYVRPRPPVVVYDSDYYVPRTRVYGRVYSAPGYDFHSDWDDD